jgi:hypothetical protein
MRKKKRLLLRKIFFITVCESKGKKINKNKNLKRMRNAKVAILI